MKVVGRPVRTRRDAAPVRAPERGDDEGRGRVPRAAHGEGRRGGKGIVVIGTVKGDVHDIGKNLVDIILTNNGYEVHNIGIKAPLQTFVDKAKEVDADAIGMSGLLVKSTLIMRENLQALNELGLAETPVILGGAALTRTYVERDLREVYDGRLFYGKDAFEGLHTMDHAHGGQAHRHARARVRARARRSRPAAPPFRVEAERAVDRRRGAFRCRRRRPRLHPAVPRFPGREGRLARRDRRIPQRDRAVPQPVAVPARQDHRRERHRRSRSGSATRSPRSSTRRRPRAGSCPRWCGATSR